MVTQVNTKKTSHSHLKHLDLLLVFIGSVGIFSFVILKFGGDIKFNIQQLIEINNGELSYPPNFLFFLFTSFISGFSTNSNYLSFVVVVILSSSVTAKYFLTKRIIINNSYVNNILLNKRKLLFISFALLCCFSIPDFIILDRFYLGKFVPHVWHNSTVIFVFPFAIWLFWEQLLLFINPDKTTFKKTTLISVLIIINALIKPSFLFVFLPASFAFIFIYFKGNHRKKINLALFPLFIGFCIIGLLYYFIFYLEWGAVYKGTSNIYISKPFNSVTQWIPYWYVPISFIVSFAFPIVVFCFYFKKITAYIPFVFALTLTMFGIIISTFIMEEGPRQFHGNFTWQNVICTYLLFLTSVTFLIPKIAAPKSKKLKVIMVIFGLHVLGGLIYICKMYITSSYY